MAGSERKHPGAFRAASRNRDHDANKIGQREFVAAGEAGPEDAIEAGREESIVDVLGKLARFFEGSSAFTQQKDAGRRRGEAVRRR